MPHDLALWTNEAVELSQWKSAAADGSRADLTVARTDGGSALCLDFDLAGPTSWVIARRELAAELPAHYVVILRLRGDMPPNQLQFKLVDPSGHNVWWWRVPNFVASGETQTLVLRKASLEFAWGPKSGGLPDHIGAVELALAAGSGGEGTLFIEELRLEARDPASAIPVVQSITASSSHPGCEASHALAGDGNWRPQATDTAAWLELDLGKPSEWGGLIVDFADAPAPPSRLLASNDRQQWSALVDDAGGDGSRRWLRTADGDGRFVRLAFAAGVVPTITRVQIVPLEQAVSPARHLAARAHQQRRGLYPRHLLNEQTYWALVGADGDARKGLLSENGALEVDAESFSIEPFLWIDGALVTWADVEPRVELTDGHLPIPSVIWEVDDLRLRITAFAAGEPGRSTIIGRYELEHRGNAQRSVRLFLALRPFQVNPAWQSLNLVGGVAPITHLVSDGIGVRVNHTHCVTAVSPADACGTAPSEIGLRDLLSGNVPTAEQVDDPVGFAEAVWAFDLTLAAGERSSITIAAPLFAESPPPPAGLDRNAASRWVDAQLSHCIEHWRRRLECVPIELPPCARDFTDSLRASIAWVLVNRDGPRIQPGPRCYRRSWIRDGTLTGTALTEMGFGAEAREFLRWYAPFQREDGQVPCAVDHLGIDPVDEHDSHGQLIWGIVEVFRLTGDRAFLVELWPHVLRAVDAIELLRARRLGAEYRGKACFGLMPESISHEGYSSRPVHSYWDDFFAVRGLADAADAAALLGDPAAPRIAALRDGLRADLHASVVQAIAEHGLDFIPGSVELGDFDPTSTAIALDPGGEGARLPAAALLRTFERYWEEFEGRRSGGVTNEAYTAYEVRNAPALVLLGQRHRAVELLQWLIDDQRPPAWRQWPEVSTRDPRAPRFLGDLPHGWIASSFVRSVRRMLAYERADDGALILAAGVPEEWVRQAPGVSVRHLPTHCGHLDYTMYAESDARLVLRCSGDLRLADAGVVVHSPIARPIRHVVVDGTARSCESTAYVTLPALPRELVLFY